jgi:hypothetical protein
MNRKVNPERSLVCHLWLLAPLESMDRIPACNHSNGVAQLNIPGAKNAQKFDGRMPMDQTLHAFFVGWNSRLRFTGSLTNQF